MGSVCMCEEDKGYAIMWVVVCVIFASESACTSLGVCVYV